MPLTAILETAVYTSDLDAAEAFYGGILGLTKRSRMDNRFVFYECGTQMLLVFNPDETIGQPPPIPRHGPQGPGHLCFAAEPDGIDAWRERLIAAGVEIETEIDWPNGARSIYFRDPAGNSLEIAEHRLWFGE